MNLLRYVLVAATLASLGLLLYPSCYRPPAHRVGLASVADDRGRTCPELSLLSTWRFQKPIPVEEVVQPLAGCQGAGVAGAGRQTVNRLTNQLTSSPPLRFWPSLSATS